MPTFAAWALNDLVVTGPDPFSSNATGNGSSVGASTISVPNSGLLQTLTISDGDADFEDGDSDQDFVSTTEFNGTTFFSGDSVETEYSYVIRPQGSSDPADNITIYAVEVNGGVEGIASDAILSPGVTYDIVAIDSNNPVVQYSAMFVCFTPGTGIATPVGHRPVEALRVGSKVCTADAGPQPVLWRGARTVRLETGDRADQRPIRISAGALPGGGPTRDVVLSPQHKVCLSGPVVEAICGTFEVLVPVKGLTALPGVRWMNGRREITYHTLMLPRHHILFADGLRAESFYPGRHAMRVLDAPMRSEIQSICPLLLADPEAGFGPTARPVLDVGEARRLVEALLLAKHLRRGDPLKGPDRVHLAISRDLRAVHSARLA